MDHRELKDKWKEGISLEQIEHFTKKHTPEVFSTVALFAGAISSIFDFFSGAGWSVFFIVIGMIFAMAYPMVVEKKLKQLYTFSLAQEKTVEMVLGGAKIIIALFLPFLYFGFLGLLAGTSYHYYIRQGKSGSFKKE